MRTKSIYDPVEGLDGVRVLITRYYPRGVKKDRFDVWAKALSPSRELLASYRSGKKGWRQFASSFLSELRGEESREALERLAALSRDSVVTLLCYEREGLPCHRYLVRDALRGAGLVPGPVKAARRARGGKRDRGGLRDSGAPARKIRFYSRRKVARKAPT